MKKVGYTRMHKSMSMCTLERAISSLKIHGCTTVYVDKKYIPRVDKKTKLQECITSLDRGDFICLTSKRSISSTLEGFNSFKAEMDNLGVEIEFVKLQ